jgi:DEAD/DEAH box helicase domain-containing protein
LNTHENIGAGPVNLPELEMHTTAYWLCLPRVNPAASRESRLQDALIGLSNVLGNAAPVYLMCGKSDIRVMYQTRSPFTQLPTVFIYDNYPGGVGFSDKLFELHDEVFEMTERLIVNCGCEYGCPSCVGPSGDFSGAGNPRDDTLSLVKYIIGSVAELPF